jgi:hypothetical protein
LRDALEQSFKLNLIFLHTGRLGFPPDGLHFGIAHLVELESLPFGIQDKAEFLEILENPLTSSPRLYKAVERTLLGFIIIGMRSFACFQM